MGSVQLSETAFYSNPSAIQRFGNYDNYVNHLKETKKPIWMENPLGKSYENPLATNNENRIAELQAQLIEDTNKLNKFKSQYNNSVALGDKNGIALYGEKCSDVSLDFDIKNSLLQEEYHSKLMHYLG